MNYSELEVLDQILIKQQIEAGEVLAQFMGVPYEGENKYIIYNKAGVPIMYASESSGFCCRCMCRQKRSFEMVVMSANNPIIEIERPFKCTCCYCLACCVPCQQEVHVSNNGRYIGYIRQKCSIWRGCYGVCDPDGNEALSIIGPCCTWDLCCTDKFTIYASDGTKIGYIKKKFAGILKEMATDADNFGVTFPQDLSVDFKALLIAATFLIDFQHYETGGKVKTHDIGNAVI